MIRAALTAALSLSLVGPALALPVPQAGPPTLLLHVQQRQDFQWQPPVYDLGSVGSPAAPLTPVAPTPPVVPPVVEPPQPPKDPSVSWAYQWYGSGIGPLLRWFYNFQCTKDRVNADPSLCGPRPVVNENCYRGMVSTNQGDNSCAPGYPYLHTYRYEGTLMGQPKDSSLYDVDASGNPMGSSGKPAIFNPAGKGF